MTRPQPDDDRVVEFDDDLASAPIRDGWEPGGWEPSDWEPGGWEPGGWHARAGMAAEDERRLRDEVPPHWA